jgi:hypothetical protein
MNPLVDPFIRWYSARDDEMLHTSKLSHLLFVDYLCKASQEYLPLPHTIPSPSFEAALVYSLSVCTRPSGFLQHNCFMFAPVCHRFFVRQNAIFVFECGLQEHIQFLAAGQCDHCELS